MAIYFFRHFQMVRISRNAHRINRGDVGIYGPSRQLPPRKGFEVKTMRLITVLPLLFASLGSAPASRDRFTTAPIIVSTEQVRDWLQSWQKRLHLENWKIE